MSVRLFDIDALSTSALRRVVEDGGVDVPRTVAIEALMTRNFPFKTAALQAVLESPDTTVGTKLVAISALARLACKASVDVLVQATQLPELRLRKAAMLALGRVAGPDLLDHLRMLSGAAGVAERDAASFAALLIACRAGLNATLPEPRCEFYDLEGCPSLAISVKAASEEQIEQAVWALADQAFGLDASPKTALSLDLGDVHWIIALDRGLVASMQDPLSAGGAPVSVLGLISEEDLEDEGDFLAAAVILAEVSCPRGRAIAYDLTGQIVHAGALWKDGDKVELELASVRRPEVAPVGIRLSIGPDSRVTARYARIAPSLTRKTRLRSVQAEVVTFERQL